MSDRAPRPLSSRLLPVCHGGLAFALVLAAATAQVFVDPSGDDATGDGSAGSPYRTISFAAQQASAGDTLQLSAGTFGADDEIVLGDKALQLVGAGVGQTIVTANPTVLRSLPRGPLPGSGEDHRVVVLVDGTARVDLRGLTVDGAGATTGIARLVGVMYRNGADGLVTDVAITGCAANPLDVGEHGGLVVRGDAAADPCLVTFRASTVTGFGAEGVAAELDAILTLEHDEILGDGARIGATAPAVGAVFRDGAGGEMRFCRVLDCQHDIAATAAGLRLADAGADLVVEGNSIARCEIGIDITRQTPATLALALRGNRIGAGTDAALSIANHSGVLVVGNVFHGIDRGSAPVRDDSAGNTWDGNGYSDFTAPGPYAIPGAGASTDANPRLGCDALDAANARTAALGGNPVEVVVADLDGANGLDFVTVNEGAVPSVSVGLENTGSYTVTDLPFGNVAGRPVAVALGEFDGQPGPDVAVLTVNVPPATTENKVYVFANAAGTLSLLHTETLPASAASPTDLAAGDLDGTNGDDLLVGDRGGLSGIGALHVLTQDGTGTVWTAANVGSYTAGVLAVAVAELEGDADLDVVAAEGDGASGRLHLFGNDGSGVLTALTASPLTVAANPSALAAADFDGDGATDLAVTSVGAALPLTPGTLTVLRNALPTGFDAHTAPTAAGPTGLALGDLGDDDDPDSRRRDAVVANFAAADLTVLGDLGVGATGLAFARSTLCTLPAASATPRSVAIADMDGDAWPDVVVADAAGAQVVVLAGAPLARVDRYGVGCPGSSDRIPTIRSEGAPALAWQPNASFGIELADARPFSVAVLNGSGGAAPTLNPCAFLLEDVDASWIVFTTAAGAAGVTVPVPPATPSLLGAESHFQWAVLDREGDLFGSLALSDAIRVRVGS